MNKKKLRVDVVMTEQQNHAGGQAQAEGGSTGGNDIGVAVERVSTKGEPGAVTRWGERVYKGASDKVRASTARGWQWRSRVLLPCVDRIHTLTEQKWSWAVLAGMELNC